MLSMEAVLGVVGAKTRGGVSRTGEIEVQCPMGVCGHKKKPVYFSVNLERGQYNCFHCCSGCPYSGGIVDLFCLFNGLDPKKRQEANKALARRRRQSIPRSSLCTTAEARHATTVL